MLTARLDKSTGRRVLCGKSVCPGVLATVRDRWGRRSLVMGHDWRPDDTGIWRQLAYGRPRGAYVLNTERVGRQAIGKQRRIVSTFTPPLPLQARCPRCAWVSELTAEALRISDPSQLYTGHISDTASMPPN